VGENSTARPGSPTVREARCKMIFLGSRMICQILTGFSDPSACLAWFTVIVTSPLKVMLKGTMATPSPVVAMWLREAICPLELMQWKSRSLPAMDCCTEATTALQWAWSLGTGRAWISPANDTSGTWRPAAEMSTAWCGPGVQHFQSPEHGVLARPPGKFFGSMTSPG
jgi:hypothetical protein